MSALQKLAVSRDAGTSRPATASKDASKGQHQQNESPSQPQQQDPPLHPLLQSLDFRIPASLQSAGQTIGKPSQHVSVASRGDTSLPNSDSNKQRVRQSHGLPHGTAQSAAALAQALKQNPTMLLDSKSVEQLLASLTAQQEHQQLHTHQPTSELALKQQLHSGSDVTASPATASGSNSSSHAAQVAPFAQTKQQLARPVTPHKTKPYRPGSVKQLSPSKLMQRPGTSVAAAGMGAPGSIQPLGAPAAALVNNNRPRTAGDARATVVQQSSTTFERPSTAAVICPWSAAASKLLRSIDPGSMRSKPGAAAGIKSDTGTGQQQQELDDTTLPGQARVDNHSSAAAVAGSQHHHHHHHQQDSDDLAGTRPTTAAMRALLMSRSGHDPGVLERLAWYECINSANDSTEGLDIVHEAAEEDTEAQEDVPDWLASDEGLSSAAAQAAAMVLNLEDVTQSTPEFESERARSLSSFSVFAGTLDR